jgi:hypothetical protein
MLARGRIRLYGQRPSAARLRCAWKRWRQICKPMWTEEHPTFTGKHFSINNAAATPRPGRRSAHLHGSARRTDRPPVATLTSGTVTWRRRRGLMRMRDIVRPPVSRTSPPDDVECSITVGGAFPNLTLTEACRTPEHLRTLGATHLPGSWLPAQRRVP